MIALVLPFIVGGAFVMVLGVIFLVAMVLNFYQVFTVPHYRMWNLISAIFYGIAGVLFIAEPLAALFTLTFLIGWLLVIGGIIRLVMSFRAKSGWMAFNGIITLILGILIIATMPNAMTWVIGTFIGIELIFTGITLITMNSMIRRISDRM